ncbi:MAG: flagellar hook assembly protein FlgD [Aestuariivirga sp.]|uniref:flagellar hook assembly protein FlgD n=1 Tax=Aestuariivirga sp. TaxID=2650926 RepID=UPI0025C11BC1|nr:flagellar hook assembly protein FlgD [Aestuariivirga sp.]MCA3561393.1 flagellar hook assembly protein FlgD [Aestuariivirga sp.]
MTTVNPTANSPASISKNPAEPLKTNMDYDSFLRLFMAQMKNQDPTKPNDPAETLSQLASFSTVEQSIKLNGKLDSLLSSSNATLASVLIGRKLSSLDGSVSGVATSVTIGQDGPLATLKDGRTLALGGGYSVSAA